MPVKDDRELHLQDGSRIGALVSGAGDGRTVIFAHGSGSSRLSTRNQHVASILQGMGLQTVLIDLLTREEERVDVRTREHRFDIPLLAERVTGAIDWWRRDNPDHQIGLFGASTGAAAALLAATLRPGEVKAVVSRGGRPDLADGNLRRVRCPTLLIVGGRDTQVIELNASAQAKLECESRLEIVPDATHLFEEPGALDVVADLAGEWFREHLRAGSVTP